MPPCPFRDKVTLMKASAPLLAIGLVALGAVCASAQTPPTGYKLHEMNFDMWCQETMHYSAERCDRRDPKDNQAFQDYLRVIEKYELEQDQRKRADEERTNSIMYNNTVGQPASPPTPQPGAEGTVAEPH